MWAIAVQIAMGTATNINTSFEVPWPMTIAVGVTNVVGDVGVLLIPQPVIWKLQQSFRARMFLSGVFFMGILSVPVLLHCEARFQATDKSQCHFGRYHTHTIVKRPTRTIPLR